MNTNHHLATLGGGCFWCLEAVFQEVEGVARVVSGYAGGHVENPTYQQVCLEVTGHAEVVQLTFDPNVVSYDRLLDIFFTIHDPTTPNQQGADRGTQYRSAIFYHTDSQEQAARAKIEQLSQAGIWDDPVVTTVTPLTVFYPAEDYHQNYFRRNPLQPYCLAVVRPKVTKYRDKFVR